MPICLDLFIYSLFKIYFKLAGVARIELARAVLETAILPLNYTPMFFIITLFYIVDKGPT